MIEAAVKAKGGRPRKGEEKAHVYKLDLKNGWLPQGVMEDDSNREVCRTLKQTWTRLTQLQQRAVIMFDLNQDAEAIANGCGYGGKPHTAASKLHDDLKMPVVRQVQQLRTLLVGNTIPTVISRRVLAQMIMGTHPLEMTPHTMIRAIQVNAQLAGELIPEIKPEELPAGATADATREESDRIMRETMGRTNVSDDIRKRAKAAAKEREEALRVDAEDTRSDEAEKAAIPVDHPGLSPMERLVARTAGRRA